MNTRYHSLLMKCLYVLAMASVGCSSEEGIVDDIGHEQTTENKKTSQNPPSFNVSGGWSLAGDAPPRHFCDMYLAADAFVFGSIVAVEMAEEPFTTIDPQTGSPSTTMAAQSIDECISVTPALKITVEISFFLTNYAVEQSPTISLYIGPSMTNYMEPQPVSDTPWPNPSSDTRSDIRSRMITSNVYWNNNKCDAGGACPLEVDQQIGFFAMHDASRDLWYLSEWTFWANSAEVNSIIPSQYENIQNKKSLTEINESIDECSDYTSQYADHHRTEESRNSGVIHNSLPRCRIE
jgi:hypothetical protein